MELLGMTLNAHAYPGGTSTSQGPAGSHGTSLPYNIFPFGPHSSTAGTSSSSGSAGRQSPYSLSEFGSGDTGGSSF